MFKLSYSIFISLGIIISTQLAHAERIDFKVFDVRKNLALTDDEPVFYDYYLSAGQDVGVEPGSVLTVYRRVPVMDIYKNQNHPDMQVVVARMKIIYSQKTMSVGRVLKLANKTSTPVMEFDKVMIGDRVELTRVAEGKDDKDTEEAQEDEKQPEKKAEGRPTDFSRKVASKPVQQSLPPQPSVIINSRQD